MDKNDILDYVTETPGNTNRAVLGSMLDSIAGSGGGGKFVVHFSLDGESAEKIVADKTIDEIIEAKNSGKDVVGDFEESYILELEVARADEGYKYAAFIKMLGNMDGAREKLRSVDMLALTMLKYEGEELEIRFDSPTGKFIDEPCDILFNYNSYSNTYHCYNQSKNAIYNAIISRTPIVAILNKNGDSSIGLNYRTEGDKIYFTWFTYSNSNFLFHTLSGDRNNEENTWDYSNVTVNIE